MYLMADLFVMLCFRDRRYLLFPKWLQATSLRCTIAIAVFVVSHCENVCSFSSEPSNFTKQSHHFKKLLEVWAHITTVYKRHLLLILNDTSQPFLYAIYLLVLHFGDSKYLNASVR